MDPLSSTERVVALLSERLGIDPAEVRVLLSSPRCTLELGADETSALEMMRDVVHAGGQAELERRTVEIPWVRVLLDDAGANRLSAVVALRQHVDIALDEALRLVASAPIVVVEAMDEPRALALIASLQAAGARARSAPRA